MMPDRSHEHQPAQADEYDVIASLDTNVADDFTMVAVGDLLVSRALTKTQGPDFDAVLQIIQDADATFGNLETNIFDIRTFDGHPQAEYGGAYVNSLPELAPDLAAMGFNLLSRANNHTLDWGVEGMRETGRLLDQNGIIHAGAGENLSQAGAARFLETARGRVALISCASSFMPMARAADSAGEAPGRPGLNSLRLKQNVVVPRETLETVRGLRDALPLFDTAALPYNPHFRPHPSDPDRVELAEVSFKAGDEYGYSFEPNQADVAGILRNVRRGKQFSDFLIVTNHGHEPKLSDLPPDYAQQFAYNLIDAGADAYIVHGPHKLRGIEIYKGRPIFYSLGDFIYDDLRTPVGADHYATYGKDPRTHTDAEVTLAEMTASFTDRIWYESVIAVVRYEGNQLAELRLHPIELNHTKRFANRGVPRLAPAAQGQAILKHLQKLSEPFGTRIDIVDGVGVVRPDPAPVDRS